MTAREDKDFYDDRPTRQEIEAAESFPDPTAPRRLGPDPWEPWVCPSCGTGRPEGMPKTCPGCGWENF